jgi:hypothetical protein
MFSFSTIKKSGLIHENGDFIVHPTFDKIMLLSKVNKFFFGINNTPITNPQYLLMNEIIIKYNNDYYLIISKLNKFINAVGNMENQEDKYLHINYYNFIDRELNGIQKDLYEFNKSFIDYLNTKKPLFFNTIIKMFSNTGSNTGFNGILVGIENNTNMICIKYDNISITYGYDNLDMKLYINLLSYDCKKLYNDIKEQYLMMDIDRFVCYNLTKITDNDGFSSLLVSSHNNKEDFCIPIYMINMIIRFKNSKAEEKYIERFTNIYKEDTVWNNRKNENYSDIHLNFEGFNKYFLNLEASDLDSIHEKEIINDFYYKITNELITSYKSVYYNK